MKKNQVSFSASVYQTGNNGEKSFSLTLQPKEGAKIDASLITPKTVSSFLAGQLYKIFGAQVRIQKKSAKHRFFKLAKGKSVFLQFRSDVLAFDTSLEQEFIGKIAIGEMKEAQFRNLLFEVITVLTTEIELK